MATYEGKINGEIRRILRHLEEACAEQEITVYDVMQWYVTNEIRNRMESNERERSYRERTEAFVNNYVRGEKKDICVAVLCFISQYEKCPSIKSIIEEISSNVYIVHASKENLQNKICDALREMIEGYRGKKYKVDVSWTALRQQVFSIGKSL